MRPTGEGCGGDAWTFIRAMTRLFDAVMDDLEPSLDALGISLKAYFLLEAVAEHPSPSDLARRMDLPPPTVTYLIKQLERRGLIERRAEAGDLRRSRLVQTPAGVEAVRAARVGFETAFAPRARRAGPGELAALDRIIGRLAGPDGPTPGGGRSEEKA